MKLRECKSENRINKIKRTLCLRQESLRIVLENIHDPHNVSAIFRSCDATGVPKISLIYTNEVFPKISRTSSASAKKWVYSERFETVKGCFEDLKSQGFSVLASSLKNDSKNLYSLNLTKKVALVFGNEHRGISEEVEEQADGLFYIPMNGMIQSLNVSVATAVTLYEALRQRTEAGMYEEPSYPNEKLESLIDEWCDK
ncbi:MAG: TrmH family RNA methyltransferase [Ignavibacteriaceae bacterium]|jgi:tRNA (guanosine-2'-O-)-methyltransferase|nr:TrmH family RNA methyltransferase [Ignavibacteriaceae bacterium]